MGKFFCVSGFFWFQNFADNRGVTILSIVFVSQCQKICGEPSNDSKKGHPKSLCIIGEFHGFPFKLSSLTVPKKIMGERFCLSEKFSYGKSLWIRRRVSRFSVEMFCPKSPKDIVDKPLCVSEMFWYQNFLDNRGITILSNFFLSHIAKNNHGQTRLCFRIILVLKFF